MPGGRDALGKQEEAKCRNLRSGRRVSGGRHVRDGQDLDGAIASEGWVPSVHEAMDQSWTWTERTRNPDGVFAPDAPVRMRSAHAARRRLSAATTLLRCGRSRSISRKMPTVVEEISEEYESIRASCEDDVGFAVRSARPCLCFCPVPHTPIEKCEGSGLGFIRPHTRAALAPGRYAPDAPMLLNRAFYNLGRVCCPFPSSSTVETPCPCGPHPAYDSSS